MDVSIAGPECIAEIMRLERIDGFDGLVGRWSADQHAAEMELASSLYFIAREGGEAIGFVMVQNLGDPHRKAHLRRIAVARPGDGNGTRLMTAVLDWLYANTKVNRIDLDVYVDNDRAKRSYEKVGFRVEGRLREFHRNVDGSYRDMWLMSILRADRDRPSA